jgi:hypothetical protein
MTLKEARKLATPGPHESHVMYGGPSCNCQVRCEDCLKRDRILAARKALAVHCDNHFDEGVRLLRQVREALVNRTVKLPSLGEVQNWLDKAGEVET